LLDRAQSAYQNRQWSAAVDYATQALAAGAESDQCLPLRAAALGEEGNHERAVADYDHLLKHEPSRAEWYQARGVEHLKLAQIEASLADFDRFLELRPDQAPGHWMRGIVLYYAGRYADGRKQFEQ
jgi:lipoprotein NlpI